MHFSLSNRFNCNIPTCDNCRVFRVSFDRITRIKANCIYTNRKTKWDWARTLGILITGTVTIPGQRESAGMCKRIRIIFRSDSYTTIGCFNITILNSSFYLGIHPISRHRTSQSNTICSWLIIVWIATAYCECVHVCRMYRIDAQWSPSSKIYVIYTCYNLFLAHVNCHTRSQCKGEWITFCTFSNGTSAGAGHSNSGKQSIIFSSNTSAGIYPDTSQAVVSCFFIKASNNGTRITVHKSQAKRNAHTGSLSQKKRPGRKSRFHGICRLNIKTRIRAFIGTNFNDRSVFNLCIGNIFDVISQANPAATTTITTTLGATAARAYNNGKPVIVCIDCQGIPI